MISDHGVPSAWRPDTRFWVAHLVLPLLVAAMLLTFVERSGIDLWLADQWFAVEGHRWAWRDHWLTYDVIHHFGKQMIIGFGLLLLTLIALGYRTARLRRWRMPLSYLLTFGYSPGVTAFGHCFPSGHSSGGFALLAIYFAAFPYTRRPALFLLPGLVIGFIFALGQQARGGHFLSHDLWTLSLCWFGALALFLLFRPQRRPGPHSLPGKRPGSL